MKKELAEELTQAVGQSTSGAWRTIVGLKALGVPKVLGLTEEEWLKKYLGNYIQLAVAERYDAVIAAKNAGLKTKQIAEAAGVTSRTIRNELKRQGKHFPLGRPKGKQTGLKNAKRGKTISQPLTELAAVTITQDQHAEIARAQAKADAAARRTHVREARVAPPLPDGRFRLIYADPPWRYEHVKTESRAIENQYPTMGLDELLAFQVPAAADALLFLWATSPKLAEAMQVIEAWGFTYRTCAVWDKEVIGMGYYFRQQHELLLVATCGEPPVPKPELRVPSVFRAKRSEHSEKPTLVYGYLEAMYPEYTHADRVELFARDRRAAWSRWSNEPVGVTV